MLSRAAPPAHMFRESAAASILERQVGTCRYSVDCTESAGTFPRYLLCNDLGKALSAIQCSRCAATPFHWTMPRKVWDHRCTVCHLLAFSYSTGLPGPWLSDRPKNMAAFPLPSPQTTPVGAECIHHQISKSDQALSMSHASHYLRYSLALTPSQSLCWELTSIYLHFTYFLISTFGTESKTFLSAPESDHYPSRSPSLNRGSAI